MQWISTFATDEKPMNPCITKPPAMRRRVAAAPESPQWKIIKTNTRPRTWWLPVTMCWILEPWAMGRPIAPTPFSRPWIVWPGRGGTVFVPDGRYVIKGNLQFPRRSPCAATGPRRPPKVPPSKAPS